MPALTMGTLVKTATLPFRLSFRGTIGSSQLSAGGRGLQLLYLQCDSIQTMEGKFSYRKLKTTGWILVGGELCRFWHDDDRVTV